MIIISIGILFAIYIFIEIIQTARAEIGGDPDSDDDGRRLL
jgi:hypothetical protein